MFGNYKRALDDKNRVLIPSKLRKDLSKVLYITLGPDNVLVIRNKKDFFEWKEKLLATNSLNKNVRTFTRVLLGNTFDIELDKQGRIAMPEKFIAKTKITKEITFVGVGTKIEIWPTEAYDIFEKQFDGEGSIDDLANKLFKDGMEI